MRGERSFLIEIGKHLGQLFDKKGRDEFAKYFDAPKNHKISKTDTGTLSVGLFYGKNLRNVSVDRF